MKNPRCRLKLIRQQETHQDQHSGGQADHHHPAQNFKPGIRGGRERQGGGDETMQHTAACLAESGFHHFRSAHKDRLTMRPRPGNNHGVFTPVGSSRRHLFCARSDAIRHVVARDSVKFRMGKTPHIVRRTFLLKLFCHENKQSPTSGCKRRSCRFRPVAGGASECNPANPGGG